MAKLQISDAEFKIIIAILEELASFLMSKTDLSNEDKARLIAIQDRLQMLHSKEQAIADGK